MPGRHHTPRGAWARVRWLAGAAIVAMIGAVLLSWVPANASSTVNAQLSLSGVATSTSVAGGSEVGVHPGDTVVFKASALPTAGLDNIPALGPVLQSVLGGVLGQYQVVVSFGSSFPGGAKTVTLGGPTSGKCAGQAAQSFTFPDKGSYDFTWKVQYVLPILFGCTKNGLSDTDLNLLGKAGVELNAQNSWVGKVVVADDPPKGGISIQLPGVSVAPKIAGHQLPTIGVPGLTLPTLGIALPNLPGGLGGAGGSSSAGSGSSGSAGGSTGGLTGGAIPVPAQVVPAGDNAAVFGGGGGLGGFVPTLLGTGSGLGGGNAAALVGSNNGHAGTSGKTAPAQQSTGKDKTIELASSKPSTGQLSVVLAILAVIALTLVAATYARLYVLRKP